MPYIVNPIGLQNIGWKYYLVYVAILSVESFIAYGWFIETKGKALEEIALLFDKDQVEVLQVELVETDKADGKYDEPEEVEKRV